MKKIRKDGKKAYLRTLEAIIAVGLTLLFLAIINPWQADINARQQKIDILPLLEHNQNFRNCVASENVSCANTIIQNYIPGKYNYTISITANTSYIPALPGKKTIIADSIYIHGNDTVKKQEIVRLYYWVK